MPPDAPIETWRLSAEVFRLIVLCGVLIWAAYEDLRSSRIPNPLTLTAIVAGFLLTGLVYGVDGLRSSAFGVLAGAGPLLVVYMIGLAGSKPYMGAGDVKLMAGIGAFAGPAGALWSILYSLFIAGAAALCIVAYCMSRRREIPKTIPFGACLAFGAVAALVFQAEKFSALIAQTQSGQW